MSETTKALEAIQKDFKDRFGVEIDIRISIHGHTRANTGIVTKTLANYIAGQIAAELGAKCRDDQWVADDGILRAMCVVRKGDVDITVFYPPEQ